MYSNAQAHAFPGSFLASQVVLAGILPASLLLRPRGA
jgi:hypothetical protein